MRGYDLFLICLAGLGLGSLGAGAVTIALTLSFIGLPLAFVTLALPSCALVLCLARILDLALLRRLMPGNGATGSIAAALVLVALTCVSLTANQMQRSEMLALQRGDHDDLSRPVAVGTLAYVSQAQTLDCRDFCQRLLLTGQAQEVLVAEVEGTLAAESPDPATPAQSWRIEDRPSCPPVPLGTAEGRLRIAGEPAGFDAPRADLLMGAGIAAGRCLIGKTATLATADVVITDLILRQSVSAPHAGFSFGSDLISANRRTVWVRSGAGLTEQARWTRVAATRMVVPALPVVHLSMDSLSPVGFVRTRATGFAHDPGFEHFVSQILGLRLSLNDLPAVAWPSGADPLLASLEKPGELDANTLQLVASRLDAVRLRSNASEADRRLFLQAFADPRVPLKDSYEGAVWALLRDAPPGFAPAVAKIGFARLDGLLLPDLNLDGLVDWERNEELKRVYPIKAEIRIIGNVLAKLPDAALQPYGSAIFALAHDHENRTEPYQLLVRLSGFGQPGARALVDLLADADSAFPDHSLYGDKWQHAYLAAMIGLCLMGPEATPVLPDVLKLVDSGEVILSDGPTGRLSIVTLIRLGLPAASIPALASHDQHPISGRKLDRVVMGSRDESQCHF